MLGDVNKLFVFKILLITPSNVLPLYLKQTFLPIIWIFTEGEGDEIKSRLPLKMFSTLTSKCNTVPGRVITYNPRQFWWCWHYPSIDFEFVTNWLTCLIKKMSSSNAFVQISHQTSILLVFLASLCYTLYSHHLTQK